MKKWTIGIAFLSVLASCKKGYDCSCEYYTNGTKFNTNVTKFEETKSKAKKKCEDLNGEGDFVMGGMSMHNETKCTLL